MYEELIKKLIQCSYTGTSLRINRKNYNEKELENFIKEFNLEYDSEENQLSVFNLDNNLFENWLDVKFEELWKLYPEGNYNGAKAQFANILVKDNITPNELINKRRDYIRKRILNCINDRNAFKQYTKHLVNWLAEKCYMADESIIDNMFEQIIKENNITKGTNKDLTFE